MTVAAVILAASPAAALADAEGTPAVRRIADAAWAGGAMPVVVVSHDDAGAIAAALATAEVTLLEPAPADAGPAGQLIRGIRGAMELVAATTGALVWPVRLAWADAETVTTLLEAHGEYPNDVLVPGHGDRFGWPALLPVGALDALATIAPSRMPDEVIDDLTAGGDLLPGFLGRRVIETGDPGTTHDIGVPRDQLPPFDGPPRPDDSIEREWGAPAADQSDDAPPAGPARLANPDPAR